MDSTKKRMAKKLTACFISALMVFSLSPFARGAFALEDSSLQAEEASFADPIEASDATADAVEQTTATESDSPAASEAAEPVVLGKFVVTGDEGSFDYADGVLTITGDGVTVSTTEQTSDRIVVAGNGVVNLDGVDIAASDAKAGITVNPDVVATFNLLAGKVNTVVGGTNHAGVEVAWQDGSTFADLTIEGEGTLEATGTNSAGIGGSEGEKAIYGNILIAGGTVVATGSGRSAGIGSAGNPGDSYKYITDTWGSITIDGGNVTATGAGNGAGIGGGNHMDSGAIIINGGTVDAKGDSGIGSGLGSSKGADKGPGHYFADITITGGIITAFATNNMGAGIGGGMYGDAKISISGGTIDARVSTNGKEYQGGAGIGGGYQGCAIVAIAGGEIVAVGGNGSPGIGNGALAAETTSSKYSDADGWTGTKVVRTDGATIKPGEAIVSISGGVVHAFGGYAGSGIGSGNSSEWCNVSIEGGEVTAIGYASDEDTMEGAAGIGSGAAWVSSKKGYSKETTEIISITGGNVLAIGGWGAAGIGSGAGNDTADSITIDATAASVEAYADGTKFAIDTPIDAAGSNADVTGDLLQGTFVHQYTDSEGNQQGTEGLASIILKNEATGQTKTLVQMPDGYRSYATDVDAPGMYAILTDSSTIGASGDDASGNGAYFSVYAADQWEGDSEGGKAVTYGVITDTLSNYTYLFPVKTIAVEHELALQGVPEGEEAEYLSDINGTFYFAIADYKGEILAGPDGQPWIQQIEVVDGVPQGNVYFANMNDGKFEIWETDENGEVLGKGTQFGRMILSAISTRHADGTDNNAELTPGTWTDTVQIVNTYTLPAVPAPADDADEPAATVVPATDAPVAPATVVPTTAAAATTATTFAAETIGEDAAPLATVPSDGHAGCWVHWWIILGILCTAAYSTGVLVRRSNNSRKLGAIDDSVMGRQNGEAASKEGQPGFVLRPQPTTI